MLIIKFRNDGTGDGDRVGNYDYNISVNEHLLDVGRLENHYRGDWRRLVIDFAEQLRKEINEETAERLNKTCGFQCGKYHITEIESGGLIIEEGESE